MNKMKKLGAALLALTLGASTVIPGLAAMNYTPVDGTSTTFTKYLIMDEGDSVPNVTFSFTVAPGEAISADTASNDVMEVMAGVGTPTIADVTFAPGDDTTLASAVTAGEIDVQRTNADRGGIAGADAVQLDAGEKYAKKTATIDFSSVSFPEPGIYRYIVTETASATNAAAGIIHDTDVDRVLDVYVTDAGEGTAAVAATEWYYGGNTYASQTEAQAASDADSGAQGEITDNAVAAVAGGLQVSGYVLHTDVDDVAISATMGSNDVASAGAALSDKTDGFTNEYTSKDLRVSKSVAGNQASRDKYFALTVTCTNINASDSYVVSLADDSNAATNDGSADATSGAAKIGGTIAANAGQTNATTVTGAELLAGKTFYLQHGQNIVIRGLAPNASYTVTENAEDYSSAVMSGKTNSGVIGTVAGENKVAEAGFTNTRDGIIPTGVLMTVVPGVMVLVGGAAGLAVVASKKRKEDEEEFARNNVKPLQKRKRVAGAISNSFRPMKYRGN